MAQTSPARAVAGPSAETIRARAVRWTGASSSVTSSAFTTASRGRGQDQAGGGRSAGLRGRGRRSALEGEAEQTARRWPRRAGGSRRTDRRSAEARGAGRGLGRVGLVVGEPAFDGSVDER